MSLTDIVRELDKDIQREYTCIGRKISEGYLYKITSSLGILGGFGLGLFEGINSEILPWLGFSFLVPDTLYNGYGLNGKINSDSSSDATAVNLDKRLFEGFNRRIRFPIFLTGAFCLGNGLYNIVNSSLNGEPLNSDTNYFFRIGVGLLCSASSMYLKDSNPKLLDKKSFLRNAYDWVRDRVSVKIPQPIAVK